MNLRQLNDSCVTIAVDETTTITDVDAIFAVLNGGKTPAFTTTTIAPSIEDSVPSNLARTSPFMTHSIFNSMNSEHEMLRYLKKLENRDMSLVHTMIPLGSCTMKLNATSEMMPVTWPELANIHPFAPLDQVQVRSFCSLRVLVSCRTCL